MTEADSWREQQLQFEEQLVSQTRAKQEAEVEVERCKQVMHNEWCVLVAEMLNIWICFPELVINAECFLFVLNHRRYSIWRKSITEPKRLCRAESRTEKMKSKSSGTRSVTFLLKCKCIIWEMLGNLQINCVFQLTNKTISNSQTELENRLHQLTETLIQKQTMLEALGTEKSSLVFQLERLEEQLKNAQGGQSGGPSINMSNLEGPGRRTSADPEHEHGVKKASWI